jgi:hypothetical protein
MTAVDGCADRFALFRLSARSWLRSSLAGVHTIRPADVLHTLVVVAELEAPFGLDQARWRLGDRDDNALALASTISASASSSATAVPASPSLSNPM